MNHLKENHPDYKGKSSADVTRMRASLLLSLASLTDETLLYVRAELESGIEPSLVAAAAVALRKSEKASWMSKSLITALDNIRLRDNYITLGPGISSTATTEILKTLAWMGAYAKTALAELEVLADNKKSIYNAGSVAEIKKTIAAIANAPVTAEGCCSGPYHYQAQSHRISSYAVELEDQDGNRQKLQQYLKNNTTLIAFFYTRCDNPLKCSLTVTFLAQLQAALQKYQGIQLAAISYDSQYDLPHRLKAYGEARGFHPGPKAKLFRITAGFDALAASLDISVNFANGIVNRHAVELFVIGPKGKLLKAFRRHRPGNSEITEYVLSLEKSKQSKLRHFLFNLSTAVTPVLVLLLPKCPLCIAAYFSFFGITATRFLPFTRYIFPALCFLLAIHLYTAYRMAATKKRYLPFFLCLAGYFQVLVFGYLKTVHILAAIGLVCIAAGTLLNRVNRQTAL